MFCKLCENVETPQPICEYCWNDLMKEFIKEVEISNNARIADALEIIASAVIPEFKDRDAAIRIDGTICTREF